MKASRFTEQQTIESFREQEAGAATADVCRKHGIGNATFYKLKAKFDGLEVSDAKLLKALEDENAKLKEVFGRSDARQRHAQGHHLKKWSRPPPGRNAASGCHPIR